FACALFEVTLDLVQYLGHGERTARAAALRDHAEGAGMVAAVLHRHERPGMSGRNGCRESRRIPGPRIELAVVCDQSVHFGHCRNPLALDLRCAARYEEPRSRVRATSLADRLAGVTHRFGGDGTAVDH